MASQEFVFKPISEGDGNLVILTPGSTASDIAGIELVDSNGRVIESNNNFQLTNEGRPTFRFSRPGSAFGNNLTVRVKSKNGNSQEIPISSGGSRVTRQGLGGDSNVSSGGLNFQGDTLSPSSFSGSGGEVLTDRFGNQIAVPEFVDFNSREILTQALSDAVAQGDNNIDKFLENFDLGRDLANRNIDTEIEGLQRFVPEATTLIRAADQEGNNAQLQNADVFDFRNSAATRRATQQNTTQRAELFDQEAPGVRDSLTNSRDRLETDVTRIRDRESQPLVSDALRAVAARSARGQGAELGATAGFGLNSGTTNAFIDRFDLDKRIELDLLERTNARQGDTAISNAESAVQNANLQSTNVFNSTIAPGIVDFLPSQPTPFTTNIGGQINATPSVDAGSLQRNFAGDLTDRSTISPAKVFDSSIDLQDREATFQQDIFNTIAGANNTLFNKTENSVNQLQQQRTFESVQASQEDANAIKNILGLVGQGVSLADALGILPSLGGSKGGTTLAGIAGNISSGLGISPGITGTAGTVTAGGAVPTATGASITSLASTAGPFVAAAAGAYLAGKGITAAVSGNLSEVGTAARLQAAWTTGGLSELVNLVDKEFGSGKSKEQQARDSARERAAEANIISGDSFNVPLADGSSFDIGIDGDNTLTNLDGGERSHSSLDDSNPLHFVLAPLAESAALAATGRTDLTGNFVNAAASNTLDVGESIENLRSIFSGTSFDAGVANLNTLYTQGFIDESEHIRQTDAWFAIWNS